MRRFRELVRDASSRNIPEAVPITKTSALDLSMHAIFQNVRLCPFTVPRGDQILKTREVACGKVPYLLHRVAIEREVARDLRNP